MKNTQNKHESILKIITQFFDKRKRMPTYSEIALLLGMSSKESAYRHVQKLISAKLLSKDSQGKLLPPKSILNQARESRATFAQSQYSNKSGTLSNYIPILGLVEAGLPSDAESQSLDLISLDEWLIRSPGSSYLLQVKGDSMIDAGICEGDYVLVDTKKSAKLGDIVVARIDGGFTLKYLRQKNKKYYLEPANKHFSNMYPEFDLEIQAVVIAVIRSLKA